MSKKDREALPPCPFDAILASGAERATGKLFPQLVRGRRVYNGPSVVYRSPYDHPEPVRVVFSDGRGNCYVQDQKGNAFWVDAKFLTVTTVVQLFFGDLLRDD